MFEMSPSLARFFRSGWFGLACCAATFVWIFRKAIFWPHIFLFRDTANFFDPLFRLVQEQWRAGHVPLWDPYSSGGMPLAAGGTAAVFYPAQLAFALPAPFYVQFKLYLLAHFALALWFTYLLARRLNASSLAASLASVAYV